MNINNGLIQLPKRPKAAHKNNAGRVLVIAGSRGFTGAGALATISALRTGTGLVTWAIPESLCNVAESLCIESITMPIAETEQKAPAVSARETLLEAAQESDAVILGPGLPVAGESGELMRLLVPEIKKTLILDAGGIRAIGNNLRAIRDRKHPTILTPHPGEFSDLTNLTVKEIQENRESHCKSIAEKSSATVLLKGCDTVVSDGVNKYINTSGNQGMATAGMGDVLTGIIAALIASGIEPYPATCTGAYLHGLAGDLACEEYGIHGMIASDVMKMIPKAIMKYNTLTNINNRHERDE